MITVRKVKIYKNDSGKKPLSEWIESLDVSSSSRIYERIKRIREGNLGDRRSLGGGLYEFRMPFGSGYRMYYFEVNGEEILLLCGGSKSTQSNDIARARKYMIDYKRRLL